jgi:hypothetical protein
MAGSTAEASSAQQVIAPPLPPQHLAVRMAKIRACGEPTAASSKLATGAGGSFRCGTQDDCLRNIITGRMSKASSLAWQVMLPATTPADADAASQASSNSAAGARSREQEKLINFEFASNGYTALKDQEEKINIWIKDRISDRDAKLSGFGETAAVCAALAHSSRTPRAPLLCVDLCCVAALHREQMTLLTTR